MVANIPFDLLTEIEQLELDLPCYIRKINNRNHWNGLEGDINQRAKKAVEKLFNEEENIYSLWYLEKIEQFLGVIASLTTYANPKYRNIDFICIKKEDLIKVGIEFKQVSEGKCIYVKKLHFDVQIDKKVGEILCTNLINKNITAKRCRKKLTEKILEYQKNLGCQATDTTNNNCTQQNCYSN